MATIVLLGLQEWADDNNNTIAHYLLPRAKSEPNIKKIASIHPLALVQENKRGLQPCSLVSQPCYGLARMLTDHILLEHVTKEKGTPTIARKM